MSKSEALRLADVSRLSRHHEWHLQVDAELRRLHAENASLAAALAQQDEPCLNCASLEAQNTELERKLAELEQAYEAVYKAGQAHEREECAKVCGQYELARSATAAIRARGEQP